MPEQVYLAEHFINRELSWLEFNQRVLEEAVDPSNPLLERVKFFCIVSSNLDEYFEVRVAGLKQQVESGATSPGIDGMTPAQTLDAVRRRARRMAVEQDRCWLELLAPALVPLALVKTTKPGRSADSVPKP